MGGTANFLGLTQSELRATFVTLRSHLAAGDDEFDICTKLGISYDEFVELKKRFYAHELELEQRKTKDHHYLDYLIAQRGNIADLTKMVTNFADSKQYNAMVGAIRAKAEIIEKVLDRGRDFGFIDLKREPMRLNGILITELPTAQIRTTIASALNELRQLTAGGVDQPLAEIEVGEIHSDDIIDVPSVDAPPPVKTKKVSRTKPKKAVRRVRPDVQDQEPPL